MDKVLVTGGAGFIGSHISNTLIGLGYEVAVIDNLYMGSASSLVKGIRLYEADINDSRLCEVFETEQPDYVIHEAAQIDVSKSMSDPSFDARTNTMGTLNVLECCRQSGVKKVIYASSAAVYGRPEYLGIDEKHRAEPVSFYGLSKYFSEEYIRFYKEIYGLKYTILRYSNVFGGRQSDKGEGGVISIFIENMLKGKAPVIFGEGEQTRDFIYIDDVVKANMCALEKGDNQVFNIGTGVGTSINSLFRTLNGIIGDLKPSYEKQRQGDIQHSYFNIEKSRRILGWKAEYFLEDGLQKTVEYYRDINKQNL